MPNPLVSILVLVPILLAACQTTPSRIAPEAAPASAQRSWFDGEYDNHEQITRRASSGAARTRFEITPLHQPGWYLWQVHVSGVVELSATWAMRSFKSVNGALTLTPYRALVEKPLVGKDFDPAQWIALDACALAGVALPERLDVNADSASCSTVAPGIGATAALLPIAIKHDGDSLDVRLYADQARGPDARVEARRVRWFSGWAAINGAGPGAGAGSTDWHMSRDIRIGSEGGQASLKWRDGQASGYSLLLERATYQDGNVPVLKLSVIEDSGGRTIAYAWANPEASRIGISLGWLQAGLDLAASTAQR